MADVLVVHVRSAPGICGAHTFDWCQKGRRAAGLQIQWKGGTLVYVRTYRCPSNPHVSCQKVHEIGHACPIHTLTSAIIISVRANEIFPGSMGHKLCNQGILQLFKCGWSCPRSVSIE